MVAKPSAAELQLEARRLQTEAKLHKIALRKHRREMEAAYRRLDELKALCREFGIALDLGA